MLLNQLNNLSRMVKACIVHHQGKSRRKHGQQDVFEP